jgi:hypothetical protein
MDGRQMSDHCQIVHPAIEHLRARETEKLKISHQPSPSSQSPAPQAPETNG